MNFYYVHFFATFCNFNKSTTNYYGKPCWNFSWMTRFSIRDTTGFGAIQFKCRCLLSTIAFGLYIQISNVNYVIHWKPSQTTLDYWQEVGRCARDMDSNGKAILSTPLTALMLN